MYILYVFDYKRLLIEVFRQKFLQVSDNNTIALLEFLFVLIYAMNLNLISMFHWLNVFALNSSQTDNLFLEADGTIEGTLREKKNVCVRNE